ncbi:MAG: hypothetical protein KF810_16960 [Rhizobiaceae bacterium]|nr:hypothetical protein [Rhizobiaceae bacterium]
MPVYPAEGLLMAELGDTITVPYEQSKVLRRNGWRPTDMVVMTYVGRPENPRSNRISQRKAKTGWTKAEHDFVARKLAEVSQ